MRRTKVLYLSHSAHLFGAEICLLTLVSHLDRARFEPVVVFPEDGPLKEKVEALGLRTHLCALERWARFPWDAATGGASLRARVERVGAVLEQERPDVVHTNTVTVVEGALAAKMQAVPHVWHIHEILEGHPSLRPLLALPLAYGAIEALSARVVVVSEAVRARLLPWIATEKVSVVHNGVSMHAPEGPQGVLAELGVPPGWRLAVSAGSLTPEKDFETLLRAADAVRRRGTRVRFVIAGAGSPEAVAALVASIAAHGLHEVVRYVGFRDDLPRILAGADLLVLSSRSEALPTVMLEAMALGKPVVATDCGGPAEIIGAAPCGRLVPVGDPPSLARAIWELCEAPEGLERMGRAAARRFAEEFRADASVRRFEELYLALPAAGAAPALGTRERGVLEGLMEAYQAIADHWAYPTDAGGHRG